MNLRRRLIAAATLAFAAGCTVVSTGKRPVIDPAGTWVLLPIVNHTDTPQAGLRAEAITETVLGATGRTLLRYPLELRPDAVFEPADRRPVAEPPLAWAKKQGARYALAGAVNEWRYKVGVDGEPAVGITFNLIDVASGKTVWTSGGGRSGWSREALSAVAQKLIERLLADLRAA